MPSPPDVGYAELKEFPSYASGRGQINAFQFISGNRFLVIAGKQPSGLVVNLVTRAVIKELVHTGYSLTCDPKGCLRKRAPQGDVVEALSSLDGSPFLLTVSRTGRVVWDIATHLHWTSDGKYLIVGTLDRKVLVRSVETMEPAHCLRDPSVTG